MTDTYFCSTFIEENSLVQSQTSFLRPLFFGLAWIIFAFYLLIHQ